jgi:DNA-binding transcriptional ArsR family regulator
MVVRSAVPDDGEVVDRLFQALADPTRRDIVRLVLTDERSVSWLAQRYPMSFAAVQKHVAVLERARLVHKRRHGREQLVRGDIDALRTVDRLLDQYEVIWRSRVDQMHEVLSEPEPPRTASRPPAATARPHRHRKERDQ